MNGKYEIGEYVLSNWKLVKVLGSGAFGHVYEAQREDYGITYSAAIKIITIPQSESEVDSARSEGMTADEVTDYFQDIVKQIVNECSFMSKVKGVTNIVAYEDHVVVPHDDKLGWDIIIRMELLNPLTKKIIAEPLSDVETVKMGIDICKALEVCRKMNIVHRDIKPENIMVSSLGDYKLGDFGISRTIEKTQGGLSKKGTISYMAPEVAKGEPYNHTVDIYSLGIVLYRFLNNNRGPFLPAPPATVTFSDREEATNRRISGESIPAPCQADEMLSKIILKACAYQSKDRFQEPEMLRKDLEAWLNNSNQTESLYSQNFNMTNAQKEKTGNTAALKEKHGNEEEDATVSIFTTNQHNNVSNMEEAHETGMYVQSAKNDEGNSKKHGKKLKMPVVIASIALILIVGGCVGGVFYKNGLVKQKQSSSINSYTPNTSSETMGNTEASSSKESELEQHQVGSVYDFSYEMALEDLEKLNNTAQNIKSSTGYDVVAIIDRFTWESNRYNNLIRYYGNADVPEGEIVYVLWNMETGDGFTCFGGRSWDKYGIFEEYGGSTTLGLLESLKNVLTSNTLEDYVLVDETTGVIYIDDKIFGKSISELQELFGLQIMVYDFSESKLTQNGKIEAWWYGKPNFIFIDGHLQAVAMDGDGKISDYYTYSQMAQDYGIASVKEKNEFLSTLSRGGKITEKSNVFDQAIWVGMWRWDSSKMNTDGYAQQFIGSTNVKWFFEN